MQTESGEEIAVPDRIDKVRVVEISSGVRIEISDDRRDEFKERFGFDLEEYAEVFKVMGLLLGSLLGARRK